MTGPGSARLAEVIDGQVRRRMDNRGAGPFDFATIDADLALVCDRYSEPVPLGDYEVLEFFTQPAVLEQTGDAAGGAGAGAFDAHHHAIPRPAVMDPLAVGDRVFVCWVDHDEPSATPVVIGRI